MTVLEMFAGFLDNLKVAKAEQISQRYGEVTKSLNKEYRDTESKTANSLQVGSYGRYSGIRGISDLDMLYIMPKNKWATYKDGKQSQLLTDTKNAIKARYPNTDVRVDRLVVTVTYTDFHVEVQPVFEELDGNGNSYFQYPDTYNGGSWKITKPRQEIAAMKEFVDQKNKNLRRLCKMTRAWKNKHGVAMGGLLIDTLAHNFLKSTSDYDNKGVASYGVLSRDFFEYLKDQPDQEHYKALGSGQNVRVKKKFQSKAKRAYELCIKAIEAGDSDSANGKWKKVYGRPFPSNSDRVSEMSRIEASDWRNTEEYIEDFYPVDIRHNLTIDCDIYLQSSLRDTLRKLLAKGHKISANKKLIFKIKDCDVPGFYQVKWKVLNRGAEAKRRDCIRGDIVGMNYGESSRKETTNFTGDHLVECYVISSDVVVARDRIQVPIL